MSDKNIRTSENDLKVIKTSEIIQDIRAPIHRAVSTLSLTFYVDSSRSNQILKKDFGQTPPSLCCHRFKVFLLLAYPSGGLMLWLLVVNCMLRYNSIILNHPPIPHIHTACLAARKIAWDPTPWSRCLQSSFQWKDSEVRPSCPLSCFECLAL